jgi:hypothetical protein
MATAAKDIKSALETQVKELARVDVLLWNEVPPESRPALWKLFDSESWTGLQTEAARTITGIKTHFVTLEVKNGAIHLETRQLDGSTGLTSPVLRTRTERNPDQLGRAISLMVAPDLCPVATVVGGDENDTNGVVVRFRGSALVPVSSFVKVGDVLAVSGIRKVEPPMPVRDRTKGKPAAPPPPPRIVGAPREYTLLKVRVISANGDCRCDVFTRFDKGLPTHFPGVVGVRVMKLPAVEGPVRVRLVDKDGKPHPRANVVSIAGTDFGYAREPGAADGFTVLRDGTFKSTKTLTQVACLSVSFSPTWVERFPVAIYGDEPIRLAIEVDEQKAKQAELDRTCWALRSRVADAHASLVTLYAALGKMVKEGKHKDAVVRVKEGMATAAITDKALTAELERIRKLPGANQGYPATLLKDCEVQINAFRDWQKTLSGYTAKLEEAAKLDPVKLEKEFKAQDLRDQITRAVSMGEVPEALEIFDELIKLTNDENQKIAKENLVRRWAPKSDDHRLAREVILKTWPEAQTLEEMETAVKKLAAAVKECKKHKDDLGLRKLLNTFNPMYARLEGLSQGLDSSIKSDEEQLKTIRDVSKQAREVEDDVSQWLKSNVK